MNQNYIFGVTIGYRDSKLEFSLRLLKVFRLHAKPDDASGVVRAHRVKEPGYCFMNGQGMYYSFAFT